MNTVQWPIQVVCLLNFGICLVVLLSEVFATTLKVEHALQTISEKCLKEVGHSDLTHHDLICYLAICHVPLNLHMSKANYVIYHCHTYSLGLLKISDHSASAIPKCLIAFSIATISVGPPDVIIL